MADPTTLTFSGVQMGDRVEFGRTSIRRMAQPEVQVGVFQLQADYLETGPNVVQEDRYLVSFYPNKGTRTMWTLRNTIIGWKALIDNSPHALLVETGATENVNEEFAYLIDIVEANPPSTMPEAQFAYYFLTFWIKPAATT